MPVQAGMKTAVTLLVCACLASGAIARAIPPDDDDLVHGTAEARIEAADHGLRVAIDEARAGSNDRALQALRRLGTFDLPEAAIESLATSPAFEGLRRTVPGRDLLSVWQSHRRGWSDSLFSSAYRETLSLGERVAGVSLLWAEVRYGGAGVVTHGIARWDSAYRATLDSVQSTSATDRYYQHLQRMAGSLDDGHTDARAPAPVVRRRTTGVPAAVTRVEGRFIVRAVRSPTLRAAGLLPGDEIVTIDGVPVDRHAREVVRRWFSISTPQSRERSEAAFVFLGDSGSTATLGLIDSTGRRRKTVQVTRMRYSDAEPATVRPVTATRTDDGILHLRVSSFGHDSIGVAAERALLELPRPRGVVLDLRANGGGSQDPGWRILSHFLRDTVVRREQFSRTYAATFRAWGQHAWYQRLPVRRVAPSAADRLEIPIVLLTGPATGSAAEGVTAIFRAAKLGPIIGEPTAGSTGQPLVLPLPGGGSMRVRTEDERESDGSAYINVGIQPDILVRPTVNAVRAGRDEVLEKALATLRKQ
jgi:C-terminal processing protease CtpA/Prc